MLKGFIVYLLTACLLGNMTAWPALVKKEGIIVEKANTLKLQEGINEDRPVVAEHDVRELSKINDISYKETTDDISNPYRGFYSPSYITCTETGIKGGDEEDLFLHLRIDVSAFSKAYNGEADKEFTDAMLNALDDLFAGYRKNHQSVIVRFAYDPKYEGKKSYEPSLSMITTHQKQLKGLLTKYQDIIASLECGIFGLWGEMHGSKMCDPQKKDYASGEEYKANIKNDMKIAKENINTVISTWVSVVPKDIPISVRQVKHYCDWVGADQSKLSQFEMDKTKGQDRVGIYNDGYLGSDTDLNTFVDRDESIKWLSVQGQRTLYGGEIVLNDGNGTVKNTAAYMETEAFKTHTSYLNIAWNDSVVDAMKKEKYAGSDQIYKDLYGFDYIRNHLGYRFVIRDVSLTKETTDYENFGINVNLENVGFGSVTKDMESTLIMAGSNKIYEFPLSKLVKNKGEYATNAKASDWKSKDSFGDYDGITNIAANIDLPEDMAEDTYKVYLRVSKSYEGANDFGLAIRFANSNENGEVWNDSLKANYLGKFDVVSTDTIVKKESQIDNNENNNGNENNSNENNGNENNGDENNVNENNGNENNGNENNGDENDDNANIDNGKIDNKNEVIDTAGANKDSQDTKEINLNVKDAKIRDKKYIYKITKPSVSGKKGEVCVIGLKKKSLKVIKIASKVTIDEFSYNVVSIGKNAFANNKRIKKVYIGKNIKSIKNGAFKNCKKLGKVVVTSKKIKSVGKKSFYKKRGKKIKFKFPKIKKKKYTILFS